MEVRLLEELIFKILVAFKGDSDIPLSSEEKSDLLIQINAIMQDMEV